MRGNRHVPDPCGRSDLTKNLTPKRRSTGETQDGTSDMANLPSRDAFVERRLAASGVKVSASDLEMLSSSFVTISEWTALVSRALTLSDEPGIAGPEPD